MKPQGKILINVDQDLKDSFQKVCKDLQFTMTDVIVSAMSNFIKQSKKIK